MCEKLNDDDDDDDENVDAWLLGRLL